MQFKLSRDIVLSGTTEQVKRARKLLSPVVQVSQKLPLSCSLSDGEIRIALQDLIDECHIKALVVHKGHRVWSRKRIMNNLQQIRNKGTEGLGNYFYEYIKTVCGVKTNYFNRKAWIAAYPTVDAFGAFFLRNEFGQNVIEYIPEWKADARRIAADIERALHPFASYVRNKRKS